MRVECGVAGGKEAGIAGSHSRPACTSHRSGLERGRGAATSMHVAQYTCLQTGVWMRYKSILSTPSLASDARQHSTVASHVSTGCFPRGLPGHSFDVMYTSERRIPEAASARPTPLSFRYTSAVSMWRYPSLSAVAVCSAHGPSLIWKQPKPTHGIVVPSRRAKRAEADRALIRLCTKRNGGNARTPGAVIWVAKSTPAPALSTLQAKTKKKIGAGHGRGQGP